MIKLSPSAQKKVQRFKSIKRGYYSFNILILLIFFSFFLEVFVNNKAVLVKYDGEYFFPTYSSFYPGTTFGQNYKYETNYRKLKKIFQADPGSENFVILPLVPFNPYENDLQEGNYPPTAPDAKQFHYLGTDTSGRDVLARILYGFRVSIFFAFGLLVVNYFIGVSLGCIMGYFGGIFDLFFQRIIEIWSNIPFLYVVIYLSSLVTPNFWSLIGIMIVFGWMGLTWQFRTTTLKEKARDYVVAAKSLGASHIRIIATHIIPNTISLLVTFIPFSIASSITSLTALDFLGFGLPAPTPSWGELLKQGVANLETAQWIVLSVVSAMVIILIMVTFIGEAVREAFDPKKHTVFK
jgi:microcin C transport system permease protein